MKTYAEVRTIVYGIEFRQSKKLARKEMHGNGGGYITPERIIKIQIGRAFNTVKKDYTYQLVIKIV